METKNWSKMQITWLGAMLIARELLIVSREGREDDDALSAVAKMNRPNFVTRVNAIASALTNKGGATLDAANYIIANGWFAKDFTPEALQSALADALKRVSTAKVWKFRSDELGTLEFSTTGCGDACDDCE